MGKVRKPKVPMPRRIGHTKKREFVAAAWDCPDTGRFLSVNGSVTPAQVDELIDWLQRGKKWMANK